ncbi:hypothetical protein CAPTEDRAFT_213122 [Capitella teleta]|uniref:G-protein coupled receptors family 1 profile domain-containing protein n=1 Tax=Capitella teleta TaxID=283909 RepID=R7VLM1_CAPTE|nr:hypothetical protein CAPTEDRAFT_213122 [Capitella teleta]|eukprot:ELU18416.1 hypothetical protein CAPTEDRAFT_213122 [Capitella teleta]
METTTEEMPQEETANVKLAIVCVTVVFSCCTIIVNLLTLVAMAMHRLIRKNSINMFIASLCLSDFLLGLSITPFQLQQVLRLWKDIDQTFIATTWAAAVPMVICFFVSNVNIFLVGVDRACATLAPLSYKSRMTTKRALIALVATWSTAVLTITACAITTVQINSGFEMLTYSYELLPEKFISYFSTPMLIISIATNAILLRSTKKIQPSSTSELRNRRMTRMITMVIGLLLLGNIPIITVATLPRNIGSQSEYFNSLKMFDDIALLLMIIPTSLNNCIYVWQMPDFKNTLMKLLFCHSNARVESTTSAAN